MGIARGKIDPCGPVLDVRMMATHGYVTALKKAGRPFPEPVTVRALIDTGASCSAVDFRVLNSLGLQAKGFEKIHTPTTGEDGEMRGIYDAAIGIGGSGKHGRTFEVGVIQSSFTGDQGFLVLIGWDILTHCVLRCDGPSKTFMLNF